MEIQFTETSSYPERGGCDALSRTILAVCAPPSTLKYLVAAAQAVRSLPQPF